ncbi:MAG: SAM-dependent DNA methyltransferase, partial [Chloroflexi bacterium]|nr:SAM-dependent DNA methyltransferase [Chloroflexota bacterium]
MDKAGVADRDKLVRVWAQKLIQKLEAVLPAKPLEADFRHAVEPLLDQFCEEVGVNPQAHAEYTLATGLADAVFDRLVIEYKAPGVLRPDLSHSATVHAVQQVKDYIQGLAKRERREMHRLAGVAFDGYYLIFVRFANEKWSVQPPIGVNQHSLERFLIWLAALSGIALTAENLNRDFAIEQPRTQNILKALSQALGEALSQHDGLVSKLFEQWRLFFSESIDYSEAFGGRKLEPLRKWVRKADIDVKTPEDAERFFFALHTYFALLVKLLAWLALSRHIGVKLGAPSFAELVTADSDTLSRRLHEMESGGIFRQYGVVNLLEGDFFSWYRHAWNEPMEGALRELLKRLDEYDPTTLTVIPEETRDLFKKLYHYLLPREIRHNLGEYYTPDWLAQRLLNQVDNEFFTAAPRRAEASLRRKLLTTRFLDPACGSGTFLVLTIARMLELGDALMVNETETLQAILNNVKGFDLNPLAVLTARVNYLLAIANILEYRRGDITVPVYIADSVRTPGMGQDIWTAGAYEFPTAMGKFLVPAPLCARERFDRFCALLEDSVRGELAVEGFVRRVENELHLAPTEWDEQAVQRLRDLYQRLFDLHRKGMDGLWARLLKNNFAPLTSGQFDYVVGNPPWVNWENLPDAYRQSIAPLWLSYELFPHKGFEAILGKSKDDISVLMSYVMIDKLLRQGGRLGFVITQSVFKTSGAGQGFRRFRIPQGDGKETPLRVVHVDDMVDLNPFEGASNRTAAMVLEKGRPTRYPVPYTLWRKAPPPSTGGGRRGARFTYDSTLEEVEAATVRLRFDAQPVDERDPTSPWLTARPKALKAIRKVLGRSDYQAHEGVNTGGANGVYWMEIVLKRPDGLVVVRNITEGAKIKVEEVAEAIEPDLLYPLLRGRDVQRWRAEPSALLLLTHEPGMRLNAIPENEMQERSPRTYGYLKRFERVLRERAAFKRYFTRPAKAGSIVETGPFYSMFDVGDYTFAPWKVVWPWIAGGVRSAVVGSNDGKRVVPEHNAFLVGCENEHEASYICALMNSSPGDLTVRSFFSTGGGGIGSPVVLENIRIPRFDPQEPVHRRLAALSFEAHEAARLEDPERLKEIEAEIDHQAAKLWGLSDEELAEI